MPDETIFVLAGLDQNDDFRVGPLGEREQAARVNQPEFRAEVKSERESLERERRRRGSIAAADVPTQPEDAITVAKFIGALRQFRRRPD